MTSNEPEDCDDHAGLREDERETIRFLLDRVNSGLAFERFRATDWIRGEHTPWSIGQALATYDALCRAPALANKLTHPDHWMDGMLNANAFLGDAVGLAKYFIRNDILFTFAGLRLLFISLFGSAVRSLIPAIYAAAILDPGIHAETNDLVQQLQAAMQARLASRREDAL